MAASASVLAFRPPVRRRLPLQARHAYSHLCACVVCRTIHEDRVTEMRNAILACRQSLTGNR